MRNLLDEYMTANEISNDHMSKMIGVSYTTLYHYRNRTICPGVAVARRIHQITGGAVPMGYWGYELKEGKFVKIPKDPSCRVKRGKYSPGGDRD